MEVKAKHVHFSFLGLLLLLGTTIWVSYFHLGLMNEFMTYFFATAKSLIILFVFMGFAKTSDISRLYFYLGLSGVFLLAALVLDDVLFRPGIN